MVADQVPGLGLPVAVGDLEPGRGAPGGDHLGVRAARRRRPCGAPTGAARSSVRFASTRYSVGAWQRTLTCSRSISSSRSAASNRPSTIIAAAPQSHGREEDVARRLRPAGRRRAPDELAAPGAEPVLGLSALAGQVALGVQRRARLAGGPEVKTISAGSSGSRSAISAGVSCGRSSSSAASTSAMRHVGDPVRQLAEQLLLADAERRIRGRACGCSRSWRRSCVLQGRAIAPMRQQASSASTHSTRVPTSVMTTSPRLTPRAASAPESPADIATSSPKCHTRRSPSPRDRQQGGLRRREALEQVLDQVHGDRSLPMRALTCRAARIGWLANRGRGAASEPFPDDRGAGRLRRARLL